MSENLRGNRVAILGYNSAGVHHLEASPSPFSNAFDTVARHAGLVAYQRSAAAENPVEQRGFAHIGASENNDKWQLSHIHSNVRSGSNRHGNFCVILFLPASNLFEFQSNEGCGFTPNRPPGAFGVGVV